MSNCDDYTQMLQQVIVECLQREKKEHIGWIMYSVQEMRNLCSPALIVEKGHIAVVNIRGQKSAAEVVHFTSLQSWCPIVWGFHRHSTYMGRDSQVKLIPICNTLTISKFT